VSLRDKIARRLCVLMDDDWFEGKRLYRSEADAILALVREHLTSDEAVKRGLRRWLEAEEMTLFDGWIEEFRAAIRAAVLAALGEGE
jgi:hypothetical protein